MKKQTRQVRKPHNEYDNTVRFKYSKTVVKNGINYTTWKVESKEGREAFLKHGMIEVCEPIMTSTKSIVVKSFNK
jgi:hypothetical protein